MKKEYVIVVKHLELPGRSLYYKCEHAGTFFTERSLEYAFITENAIWVEKVADHLRATYKDYQFDIKTLN